MRERKSIFQYIDTYLIIIYFILILIGWLNIYAAVYNEEHIIIFDMSQQYGKQLIWILSSLFIAILILFFNSRFFETFAYFFYLAMILILLATLTFGTEIKGAKSWFSIGNFLIQPAEFAKFATAIALAKYISSIKKPLKTFKNNLLSLIIIFLPAFLILLQNDTGSSLVYFAFILVLFREGLPGIYLFGTIYLVLIFILSLLFRDMNFEIPFTNILIQGDIILTAILLTIALILIYIFKKYKRAILIISSVLIFSSLTIFSIDYVFDKILEPHQVKRINVLLGLEHDPQGAGYNVNQSLIAIGSGGFSGKGFLQGTQTKFNFVPEQSTDFIFCTIGEEWGFIGSSIVILLFLFLFIRIIYIAERQRSVFSRIYAYGTASILFFHFAVNIGMTLGLAPVIGIPLPFISYGGSSLWAFTILLFVLIKLDSDRMFVLR